MIVSHTVDVAATGIEKKMAPESSEWEHAPASPQG